MAQRQKNLSANIRDKSSLAFYREMKLEWGKEEHTEGCTSKKRNWTVTSKGGVWRL
jgi:hypothetical protein